MDKDKVIAEFDGNSPFRFYIEKANAEPASGSWIVTGCASTQNLDHDQERMSAPALAQMANVINQKSVPLRYEHEKDKNGVIGKVYEAFIDDANKLMIKAELNQDSVTAKALWDGLQTGSKMGFSVGGKVKRAFRELAEGVGKVIKTFYDVELEEVSMTPRPANYDAWLTSHAFAKSNDDLNEFYGDFRFYNKFLTDNPQLDYLAVFEKSVGDKWVNTKVDSNNNSQNKNMKITKESPTSSGKDEVISSSDLTGTIDETHKDPEMTGEKKMKTNTKEDNEEVTSPVESTEGMATKSYVDEKFKAFEQTQKQMFGLLKNISKSLTYSDEDFHPLDSEQPTKPNVVSEQQEAKNRRKSESSEDFEEPTKTKGFKESEDDEDDEKEKDREGQDNTYADGDTGSEKEPTPNLKPMRQNDPDEEEVVSEQVEAKHRSKSGYDSSIDQTGAERQRGEITHSDTVDAVDSEMPVEPKVNSEQMEAKNRRKSEETNGHDEDETMKDESESDESKDSEEEEGTNKYGHDYMMPELEKAMSKARSSNSDPMGVFVYFVTKSLEEIKNELKNTNKRVLGLEPRFAEMIRSNPTIQKSIKEWMKPSERRGMAVSSGRPILTTREGGRYELMAKEVGEDVRKSTEGKDFKSLYQSEFSSQGKIGQ